MFGFQALSRAACQGGWYIADEAAQRADHYLRSWNFALLRVLRWVMTRIPTENREKRKAIPYGVIAEFQCL